jgi:hypothetical protein
MMKPKRLTIYDIKYLTQESSPYFFERKTLKFFHQTLKDFSVRKLPNGRYFITAPMRDHSGKCVGYTARYFTPETNKLEKE